MNEQNPYTIRIRRGRRGRITAWLIDCGTCGVDRDVCASKNAAARHADQHNRENHQGAFSILAPRGEP